MTTKSTLHIKAPLTRIFSIVTELIGWQGSLVCIYAIFMLIDWITGTQAAKASGEWSCEVAKVGTRCKCDSLGVILVAFLLERTLYLIAETRLGFTVTLNGTISAPLVLVCGTSSPRPAASSRMQARTMPQCRTGSPKGSRPSRHKRNRKASKPPNDWRSRLKLARDRIKIFA